MIVRPRARPRQLLTTRAAIEEHANKMRARAHLSRISRPDSLAGRIYRELQKGPGALPELALELDAATQGGINGAVQAMRRRGLVQRIGQVRIDGQLRALYRALPPPQPVATIADTGKL